MIQSSLVLSIDCLGLLMFNGLLLLAKSMGKKAEFKSLQRVLEGDFVQEDNSTLRGCARGLSWGERGVSWQDKDEERRVAMEHLSEAVFSLSQGGVQECRRTWLMQQVEVKRHKLYLKLRTGSEILSIFSHISARLEHLNIPEMFDERATEVPFKSLVEFISYLTSREVKRAHSNSASENSSAYLRPVGELSSIELETCLGRPLADRVNDRLSEYNQKSILQIFGSRRDGRIRFLYQAGELLIYYFLIYSPRHKDGHIYLGATDGKIRKVEYAHMRAYRPTFLDSPYIDSMLKIVIEEYLALLEWNRVSLD